MAVMDDATRARMAMPDPPSPCIGVCDLDRKTGFCRGCYRTGGEIADWTVMKPQEKRELLLRLAERKSAAGSPRPTVSSDRAAAWAARWGEQK